MLSLKTSMRRVDSGIGDGFMSTVTAVVPGATVKCWPSILKPSAVTEMRYLPAGRLSSALVAFRSFWSPWATIGANPEVGRVDGHGQVSA